MITILFIQILYIIAQEYNDYYTIHSNIIHNISTMITRLFIQILYIIAQEFNDYYTIHSNIIHNSTRVQWLLYYSFKYYT